MTFLKETETKKELQVSDLEYLESYTRFEKSEIVDWFRLERYENKDDKRGVTNKLYGQQTCE